MSAPVIEGYVTLPQALAITNLSFYKFTMLAAERGIAPLVPDHDRRQRLYRVEDVRSLITPPVPVGEGANPGAQP